MPLITAIYWVWHAYVLLCLLVWLEAMERSVITRFCLLPVLSLQRRNFCRNACSALMNNDEQFEPERRLKSRDEAGIAYLALTVFLLEGISVNRC